MSTPERAGWYDDPEDDSQLRYFDGIIWSDRTVPKRAPSREPAPVADETSTHGGPATDVFGRPTGASGQAGQPGQPAPGSGGAPGAQHQQGWVPSQSGQHGWRAPQQPEPTREAEPTTEDGQPLAGYGPRVAAYFIDLIIVGFLIIVFAGWFFWRGSEGYRDLVVEVARTGNQERVNSMTPEEMLGLFDMQDLLLGIGVTLLVFAIYHVLFLATLSATPGKRLLGLSVRRTDGPGRLGVGTAFMRILLPLGIQVVSLLPLIGYLLFFVTAADLLWPIKDVRRQALHDKIAGTQVVKGRQPRVAPGDGVSPSE